MGHATVAVVRIRPALSQLLAIAAVAERLALVCE
jgi:hypothetical protein